MSVLNGLGDGVTVANADGRIVFANPAADAILGVTLSAEAPELWGEHYGVFCTDESTPFPTERYPLLLALRGEHTDGVEMFVRNRNVPKGVVISVTGRPLRDEHGTVTGAVVVFRDVTALRRTERELSRKNAELAEAQRRQAELSAFIVHDLKSPLTAILGSSGVLLESPGLEPDDRSAINDIREAARSIHRMVLDLLDVHLAEDGALQPELETLDVASLLEDVRSAMAGRAAEKRQRLMVNVERGAEAIRADPSLLRRVLQNLVDNCVKYGQHAGSIWLDARVEGGAAVLRVRDDGPGVPPALRERIFEKYARIERDYRSVREGSRGLGLRFCQVAVSAHGGRVWVEDNQPCGACFCVALPRAARPSPRPLSSP